MVPDPLSASTICRRSCVFSEDPPFADPDHVRLRARLVFVRLTKDSQCLRESWHMHFLQRLFQMHPRVLDPRFIAGQTDIAGPDSVVEFAIAAYRRAGIHWFDVSSQ